MEPAHQYQTPLEHLVDDNDLVVRFLGSGASGHALEIKGPGANTCMKLITRTNGQSEANFTAETRNEVNMLAMCQHKYVLRLLACDLSNPKMHYIRTELCRCSLGDLLCKRDWFGERCRIWGGCEEYGGVFPKQWVHACAANGTLPGLPLTAASQFLEQILTGLQHIHVIGVVHGDMKTNNILYCVDASGQIYIKICDFGLAKLQTVIDTTVPPDPEGSYIAPERHLARYLNPISRALLADDYATDVANAIGHIGEDSVADYQRVDWRSDMPGVGHIFFEMLCGRTCLSRNDRDFQLDIQVYGCSGYRSKLDRAVELLDGDTNLRHLKSYEEYEAIKNFLAACFSHNPAHRLSPGQLIARHPDLFYFDDTSEEADVVEVPAPVATQPRSHQSSRSLAHSSQLDTLPEAEFEDDEASELEAGSRRPSLTLSLTSSAASDDIHTDFSHLDNNACADLMRAYDKYYSEHIFPHLPSLGSVIRCAKTASTIFAKGVFQRMLCKACKGLAGGRLTDRTRWNPRQTPAINHWRFN